MVGACADIGDMGEAMGEPGSFEKGVQIFGFKAAYRLWVQNLMFFLF